MNEAASTVVPFYEGTFAKGKQTTTVLVISLPLAIHL